mmetsp:Transcript_2538/g.4201  ORF Transcript_2538/g.4201 Transcript_2538/m.4201 type:complete len:243 (-) Transcript_2538:271-999(-)
MQHCPVLPREKNLTNAVDGFWITSTQVNLCQLGLLEYAENALALPGKSRHAARHVLHLLHHILPRLLHLSPNQQPLSRKLDNCLNHILTISEALGQYVCTPLLELVVESGNVSQLHGSLQRRELAQHDQDVVRDLPFFLQLLLYLGAAFRKPAIRRCSLLRDLSLALLMDLGHSSLHLSTLLLQSLFTLSSDVTHTPGQFHILPLQPLAISYSFTHLLAQNGFLVHQALTFFPKAAFLVHQL